MQPRPQIHFDTGLGVKIMNGTSIASVAIAAILVLVRYSALPDTIAVHFNIRGEADGWGSKTSVIWLIVVGLALTIGMAVLSKFPRIFNYPHQITEENAERSYRGGQRLMAGTNLLCGLMFAVILLHSVLDFNFVWILGVLGVVMLIVPIAYLALNFSKSNRSVQR